MDTAITAMNDFVDRANAARALVGKPPVPGAPVVQKTMGGDMWYFFDEAFCADTYHLKMRRDGKLLQLAIRGLRRE